MCIIRVNFILHFFAFISKETIRDTCLMVPSVRVFNALPEQVEEHTRALPEPWKVGDRQPDA